MSEAGVLPDAEAVRQFVLAGNAYLTLASARTGARFTYRVSEPEDGKGKGLFFVGLLSGPDNTSDYSYLGVIRHCVFGRTAKSRISEEAPSFKAFDFFMRALFRGGSIPPGLVVSHEGRCGRCGRLLTVPESVARGIGPECAGKLGVLGQDAGAQSRGSFGGG